jgi:hypothetical protein
MRRRLVEAFGWDVMVPELGATIALDAIDQRKARSVAGLLERRGIQRDRGAG